MTIYTKRGDKGETSLFDPQNAQRVRIGKDSLKVEVIGRIDELNSYLGIAIGEISDKNIANDLREIQRNLFTIGSILAGAKLRFSETKTKKAEKEIDKIEGRLPVLKNFILYGGSKSASHLFYARALARRAERGLVSLRNSQFPIPDSILAYMNRLSDYLFILARERNHRKEIEEETWKGKK